MNNLIINGSSAGFFSMFRGTVGTLLTCEEKSLLPFVNWQNTLYNDNPKDNAWEYYFENTSNFDSKNYTIARSHNILPREYSTRLTMNRLINKYVKIKPEINKKVEIKIKELKQNPLGVHIRMTDKINCVSHGEPRSGIPVSIDLYKKHINKKLEERDSKIFLATDDESVLNEMKIEYGDKVITTNSIRSAGTKSIHHHLSGSNRLKGEQVLIDCLVLSRCKHIIKGISNVALCAMFWNLDLTCDNLNSIYNGDAREDFVNGKY